MTIDMETRFDWRGFFRLGLLAAVIAFFLSAIGVVGTFGQRDIIGKVLSLGQIFLFGATVGCAYLAARRYAGAQVGKVLLGGAMIGLLSSLPVVVLALALAGAVLGYLPYNFPTACLFMGDVGSLSLGFGLAILGGLLASRAGSTRALVAVLVATALPIVDTSLAIARRFVRMSDIFSGDQEHIYDLLARRGLGYTHTVWVMCTVTAVLGALSLVISRLPALLGTVLTLGCYAALMAWAIRLGVLGDLRRGILRSGGIAHLRQAVAVAVRRYTHILLFDILTVVLAFYGALFLHLADGTPAIRGELFAYLGSTTAILPFIVVIFIFSNAALGLYNRWWAYASLRDAVLIVVAGLLSGAMLLMANILFLLIKVTHACSILAVQIGIGI